MDGAAKKTTANEIREQLQDQLRERFAADDVHVWVDTFDPDEQWVVYELSPDDGALELYQLPYTDTDGTVSLDAGDPAPVMRSVEYAPKSAELCGPIVRKDEAKRIVYGAVLVPGEPDADGEVLTAEKVEQVAHEWLTSFRAIDNQHSVKQIDADAVESYIEPADRTVELNGEELTIPAGTWTMAARITDEATWSEVVAGKRTGFSIMGVPRAELEAALAAVKSGNVTPLKRVTLADVGGGDPNGDWVAPFVSIVDEPAVPKAKFYAMKSQPPPTDDAGGGGMWRRLASWMAGDDTTTGTPPAAKAGRKVSDKTLGQLRAASEAISALIAEAEQERTDGADKALDKEDEMDRDEVQTLVSESVPEAVKNALADDETITKLVAAVKEAIGEPPASTDDEPAGVDEDEVTEADVLARLDKLEERLAVKSRQLPDDPDDSKQQATKSLDRDAYGRRVTNA